MKPAGKIAVANVVFTVSGPVAGFLASHIFPLSTPGDRMACAFLSLLICFIISLTAGLFAVTILKNEVTFEASRWYTFWAWLPLIMALIIGGFLLLSLLFS